MLLTNTPKLLRRTIGVVLALLLVGCSAPAATSTIPPVASATIAPTSASPAMTTPPAASATLAPTSAPSASPASTLMVTLTTPTAEARADGLSKQEAASLDSLEKIDDYPLYVMHYYGAYAQAASPADVIGADAWACSLFAALGDADNALYGRNFDWEYSPALLLFTHPPDGYASVSLVDLAYFVEQDQVQNLADLPLAEREPLLDTPRLPFDGMNERGLAVGMAAVHDSELPHDANKPTIGSIALIREMLDHASDVYEALALIQRYNVDMSGGPHIHYLLADARGQAVLVEFYQGQMFIFSRQDPWHLATNFLRAQVSNELEQCERYDAIYAQLTSSAGQLTAPDAMQLLSQVAQDHTQWSVVYEMSTGSVNVALGQGYDEVYTFDLADD